ncbi:hypothetical protein ABC255_09705 [Neobacillus sp. 3P2-tot-E-2]|uniref:hypothetical protein n=1 Tax=Neobacillus sp. 3P2-tot-E-2 TaxID=3132212 RepID=UPI0039A01B44
MRIAIYQKSGMLATVLEDVINPKLIGSELSFDNGNISGVDDYHILLESDDAVPETLEEAKVLDKKAAHTFIKTDEIADLKKQHIDLSFELMLRGYL